MHEAIFGDVATAEDPYARLFAETALPPLRSAVVNQWNPRDPEALLCCLEAYTHVLPPAARVALLVRLVFCKGGRNPYLCTRHAPQDSSVLPKLMAAVDTWDPRTEPVPIHTWIHPWLPLLRVRCHMQHPCLSFLFLHSPALANALRAQDRLVPLYAPIRHKLSSALGAWHPGDGSALALLSPWRQVFTEADWEALLSRCILPKLGWVLSQLVINPAEQQLEPVQWTLAWAAAIPARHMATLLEQVRLDALVALTIYRVLTVPRAELFPKVARRASHLVVCCPQLRRSYALVLGLEGLVSRRGAHDIRPAARVVCTHRPVL